MNDSAIEVLKNVWENMPVENRIAEAIDSSSRELEQVWPNCFLIDIADGKYSYSHFGSSLVEAYAKDMHGEKIVEDMLYPESPEFTHKLLEVLNTGEPLVYDGAFINFDNQDIKFRKALFPLGDQQVTQIVGAILWRKF